MTKSVTEIVPRDDIEKIALGYFRNIALRDLEALENLWDDDVIMEVPYLPEGFDLIPSVSKGKSYLSHYFKTVFENRRDHMFWVDEVYRSDGGIVIIEAHARSIVGDTGIVYENNYVTIIKVVSGKICLIKEYANPLKYMKAFSGGVDADT